MFRSYWLQIGLAGAALVTALLLAVITQPNAPSSFEREIQSNRGAANATGSPQPRTFPEFRFYAPQSPSDTHRETYPYPEANQQQRDSLTLAEANLLAQERVAHWTAWISGFTAIGLLALIATLLETRQVTTVTRDIGQAQVRAYLEFEIDDVEVSSISASDPPQTKITFTGRIRNTGQSPAHAFRLLFDIKAENAFPVLNYHSSGRDFAPRKASLLAIGSGKEVNHRITKTITASKDDIFSGKITAFLCYVIRYNDVFGQHAASFLCGGTIKWNSKNSSWMFIPSKIDRMEQAGDNSLD